MEEEAIHIEKFPDLDKPTIIIGFDGWGNALGISSGMASYLIRKLKARSFATLNPDLFYRYDATRPIVKVERGALETIPLNGGSFYYVKSDQGENDLVILNAREPNLRWLHFSREVVDLSERLEVSAMLILGSMYDNVLHSDKIISGIASTKVLTSLLADEDILPLNYEGPSAIHSFIYSEARNREIPSISLWCHCPYYLEGATHFGLLSHLGKILASLLNFSLDTEELNKQWKELNHEIQKAINNNKQLQNIIEEVRKAKLKSSRTSLKGSIKKGQKVIPISDFLKER